MSNLIEKKNIVRVHTGVNTVTDTSYSFVPSDVGGLVVGNSGSPQTFTIEPLSTTPLSENAIINVFMQGAGVITIAAGVGVTLIGNDTLSSDDLFTLYRDGVTDTWYVG